MEEVILVDENDKELGLMEKMEAHRKGLLHRAFSVFVFNSKNEMLIQQRAESKYHSPKLWTNTCCSHPRNNERTINAAMRRMNEEMGFVCKLNKSFSFQYKAELDQGLTEHELDHVYIGKYDGVIDFNVLEVMDYKYVSVEKLLSDIDVNPDDYTVWFKIALPILLDKLNTTT